MSAVCLVLFVLSLIGTQLFYGEYVQETEGFIAGPSLSFFFFLICYIKREAYAEYLRNND